jgi:uncharacterized membrane protein YfcA
VTPAFIVMLVGLGTMTGFLAGMLGIGGGLLLVPFLMWVFSASGFPSRHVLHMAVATSLATILFTSISSIRAHHLRRAVRWDIVRWMASGAALGTFVGAQAASLIATRWLAILFASFMGYSGIEMMRKAHRAQVRIGGPLPSRPTLTGVGGGIGLIASLIGAGGGFLTVPFLGWRGVPVREAIGSSAAIGFGIAVGGLVGYVVAGRALVGMPPYTLGFIDLPALACCAGASVLMAPLGVRAAHTLKPSTLKIVFATLMIGLAASMAWKAWHG